MDPIIDKKLDILLEHTGEIRERLARIETQVGINTQDISENADDLKEHMKRTYLLEQNQQVFEKIFKAASVIIGGAAALASLTYTVSRFFPQLFQ